MEYSEGNINKAKKILELHLLKYGVERTADLLRGIGNMQFWQDYKDFRDVKSDTEIEDKTFITLEDYEQDNSKINVSNKDAKVLWDIFSKYPEVQTVLADSVNEIDYDIMEIATRSTTINILISMIELLDEIPFDKCEGFNKLYEVVNNKIANLNNTDFCLVYTNILADNFFNNLKFQQVIKDKLNSMSKSVYIYFLLTAQEVIDINNKSLIENIKNINEKFDDSFVNKVYESLQFIDLPRARISDSKLDNVTRLIRGIDNKEEAINTLFNLTETEFMSYILYYANSTELLHENIRNSKEFAQRIKNLSNENLILLLEKYEDIYYYIKENKDADIDKNTLEYGKQWKYIFEEGKARNLIDQFGDMTFSEDAMFEAIEMDGIYNINKKIGIVPYFFATNEEHEKYIENGKDYSENTKINEDSEYDDDVEQYYGEFENNNEFDEENDEEDRTYELEELEKIYEELDSLFTFYDTIDKLDQVPNGKEIVKMINHYNNKNKRKDIEKLTVYNKYMIRYLKSRIINMPIKYATFFEIEKDGCLADAIKLKVNELQEKVLKRPDDEIQNR